MTTSETGFRADAPAESPQEGGLLARLRAYVESRPGAVVEKFPMHTPSEKRRATPPVMGRDVGLDLGRPGSLSCAGVLAGETPDVRDGWITRTGHDLTTVSVKGEPSFGGAPSFGLVAAVGCTGEADLVGLRSTFLRCGDLPGVSPRAIPGRLWIRIHRDTLAGGLGLRDVAAAVGSSLRAIDGVTAVEFLVALGDDEVVRKLREATVVADARIGAHARLRWNDSGEMECSELTCRTCDEQPICDGLRETLRIRRRKRTTSHV